MDGNLHLLQMSLGECKLAQRDIIFSPQGQLKVFIHGRQLPETHQLSQRLPEVCPVSAEGFNFSEYLNNVKLAYNVVRDFEVCCGVANKEYKPYWRGVTDGEVDNNLFREIRHGETIRSVNCVRVIPMGRNRRCKACADICAVLKKRFNRGKTGNPDVTPKAKACTKNLRTPQLKRRATRFSKIVKNLQAKVSRLRKRLDKVIRKEGVFVGEEDAKDFSDILQSANLTPFQKLFLEQQLKAASTSKTGMRYHPALIRLALHLRSMSGAAYEELGKVIRLPSERTLYEYSHAFQQTDGCNRDIISHVSGLLEKMKPYQRFFTLIWDEMHIKKSLVFRKSDGRMIGYVKQDNVEKEIELMEKVISASVDGSKKLEKTPAPLASTMLSFMIKGTANNIKQVVATYPCHRLTADFLYRKIWEVTGVLEEAMIFVMAFICDGHPLNRLVYKMMAPFPRFMAPDASVVHVVVNLFAPERPVFLFSDYIHLLKTLRNSLSSSGRKKKTKKNQSKKRKTGNENDQNSANTRKNKYNHPLNARLSQYVRLMMKNGQEITWDTVVRLYDASSKDTLRKTFKLNRADVYLNSYSVMRVSHAAHVMSRSVAEAVRQEGWENVEEFCEFVTTVNDVLDCLNGKHSYQAVKTRQELLAKYEKSDDDRFDFLEYVLAYFRQWEGEVQSLEGISPENKAKMIVSRQNLEGLEITIRSFIGATRYLLSCGTKYVMGFVYCQDDLESWHSRQRATMGSGGSNPTAADFMRNQTAMFTHSTLGFKGRKRSNATGSKTTELTQDLMEPVPKRKKINRNLMASIASSATSSSEPTCDP